MLPDETESPEESKGRTVRDLGAEFGVDDQVSRLRVIAASSLANSTLRESDVGARYGIRLLGIERPARFGTLENIAAGHSDTKLEAGDILVALGPPENIQRLVAAEHLERLPFTTAHERRWLHELGAAVILVHPECRLIGKSLRDAGFRSRYEAQVLGIRRGNDNVEDFVDAPLRAADTLLIFGSWERIAKLRERTHDFVVLELPSEFDEAAPARRYAPLAVLILIGMVLLAIFNVVPLVAAVIMAVLTAVFTRCLTMGDAYRSIHWSSVVLVAGMLPVATALQKTGGVDLIVETLMATVGGAGPYAVMSALFLLTATMGLFLSNTASAVLMAPVAITTAETLGVSPYPLALTVLIAASSAFVTPVSTPVVTLVVQPGRYRFVDFIKIGTPLLLLTFATTLLVVPIFFPL